jgi:hypothetical protein
LIQHWFQTDVENDAASNLYRKFGSILWRKHRRRLRLLKFMDYLAAGPKQLMRVLDPAADPAKTASLERALARYRCYDKWKKRRNFAEIWEILS